MTNKRSISAVIPCFNHGRFLTRAISGMRSDLRNRPDVIWIVDDGSTDDSWLTIAGLSAVFPDIKAHRMDRNCGLNMAVNAVLPRITTTHVCFPAADDRFRHEYFGEMRWLLNCVCPDGSMATAPGLWHDGEVKFVLGTRLHGYLDPVMIATGNYPMVAHTAIYPVSAVRRVGGYIPELESMADWWLSHVVALRHGSGVTPTIGVDVDVDSRSFSRSVARDRERRSKALMHLLGLLKAEEYQDIAGPMVQSGLLGIFGVEVLRGMGTIGLPVNMRTFRRAYRRTFEMLARRLPPAVQRICVRASRYRVE